MFFKNPSVLAIIGLIVLCITARISLALSQHITTYRLKYWAWLCPMAFVILKWPHPACYIIALSCLGICWYKAHAQYHLLNAQNTTELNKLQYWPSRLEMLSGASMIYVLVHFCMSILTHFLYNK